MEFMNLFTGRKIQGTTSTQNKKIKICYADQPNDECSSIDKIHQLQDEIKKKKEELDSNNFKNHIDFSNDIHKRELERRCKRKTKFYDPIIYTHAIDLYVENLKVEILESTTHIMTLRSIVTPETFNEILTYFIDYNENKIAIEKINSEIKDLEDKIKTEKQKLGIE